MMKTRFLLAAMLAASAASAQMPSPPAASPPAASTAATLLSAAPDSRQEPILLARDTPVELMAPAEVSTASATVGQIFKLRVNRAIMVGDRTIVPVGTPAFGQIVTAVDSGGLGKSGRMTAKLLRIQLGAVDIPLEGEMSAKGTGAGSAGMAILFAGWAGFFHRGNNAKIKAGEILTGFIGEDVSLDISGAEPRRLGSGPINRIPLASGM